MTPTVKRYRNPPPPTSTHEWPFCEALPSFLPSFLSVYLESDRRSIAMSRFCIALAPRIKVCMTTFAWFVEQARELIECTG
jgi:hypothetical protein